MCESVFVGWVDAAGVGSDQDAMRLVGSDNRPPQVRSPNAGPNIRAKAPGTGGVLRSPAKPVAYHAGMSTETEPTAASPRIAALLADGQPGQAASVSGWVRTRRDSKAGLTFIELNDGSAMRGIQLVVPEEAGIDAGELARVGTGASLTAAGELVESPGKGQRVELRVAELTVLGEAGGDYPLQKKRHSFEYLREIAHLRPRSNTFGAIARVRNAASMAIHDFFQSRGFLWIHTPIITASDCEGAGEMFRVTTQDPTAGQAHDAADDFFGRPAHLTVSGQLEAEIFATSLGPSSTFGPTFRAENSNTSRHLAEFWMVEPEVPFCDLDGDMALAEDFLKTVITQVRERCDDDLAFFAERIEKTLPETLDAITTQPFERVSYTDAVALLESSGQAWEHPVEWGANLQAEHERWLTETHFGRPVIVHSYPARIKPFYMRVQGEGDRATVAAMDVLVPGIGEIIGGSQREERLDVLTERLRAMDLPEEDYWWYLDLRRYGSVPHAGFGLGFERLLLLLTGMQNIRDVIPFPRTPKNAAF